MYVLWRGSERASVTCNHTFVASITAQPCHRARLLLPLRVEVPSRNHWRASSMYPISPASMAMDWYKKGLGRSCVALMPCSGQ